MSNRGRGVGNKTLAFGARYQSAIADDDRCFYVPHLTSTEIAALTAADWDGGLVYDSTNNTLEICNGTSFSVVDTATTGTADAVYNAGAWTVAVDANDVVFDLEDNTNDYNLIINNSTGGAIASALDIDAEDNNSSFTDGILFKTTGTSAAITDAIDASDTGITNAINVGANTILGTSAVINFTAFDVDASGNTTVNNLTVNGTHSIATLTVTTALNGGTDGSGVDVTLYTTTAGDNVLFDASEKTMLFTDTNIHLSDSDEIDFGAGSATGTGDFNMYSDGTDLYIAAIADVANQALKIGDATNDMDIQWTGDTASATVLFDSSADRVDFNGIDLRLQDSDILQFGDASTGDWTVTFDATNLVVTGASNSDFKLVPTGNGKLMLGSAAAAAYITTNGAYDLVLETNDGTNSGNITITDGAAGAILLNPNTTGTVEIANTDNGALGAVLVLSHHPGDGSEANNDVIARIQFEGQDNTGTPADEMYGRIDCVIRDVTAANPDSDLIFYTDVAGTETALLELNATGVCLPAGILSTLSTTDLVMHTNETTNSGILTLFDGANGNLEWNPNGTGIFSIRNTSTGALGAVIELHHETTDEANDDVIARIQFTGEDDAAAEMTAGRIDCVVRDVTNASGYDVDLQFYVAVADTETLRLECSHDVNGIQVGSGAAAAIVSAAGAQTLTLCTNADGTGASIDLESGANSDTILIQAGTGVLRTGSAGATAHITSSGTYNLLLSTNDDTNSGSIEIVDGSNEDIEITPNGTGSTEISGASIKYNLRDASGTSDAPAFNDGLVKYVGDAGSDNTVTLPEAADNQGLVLTFFFETDNGKDIVLTRTGADTIDENTDTGNVTHTMANANEWIQIMAVGDNTWAVIARQGGTLA